MTITYRGASHAHGLPMRGRPWRSRDPSRVAAPVTEFFGDAMLVLLPFCIALRQYAALMVYTFFPRRPCGRNASAKAMIANVNTMP